MKVRSGEKASVCACAHACVYVCVFLSRPSFNCSRYYSQMSPYIQTHTGSLCPWINCRFLPLWLVGGEGLGLDTRFAFVVAAVCCESRQSQREPGVPGCLLVVEKINRHASFDQQVTCPLKLSIAG